MAESPTTVTLLPFSLDRMFQAVENVKQRLLKASAALKDAGIPFAVVGGHAVAAWVSRVDKAAVRNTQDVDILVRREDFPAVQQTLEQAGFYYREILGVHCFLDNRDVNPRHSVHILFANEKVRPDYTEKTPTVTDIEPNENYPIAALEVLVRMKLTSNRDKDRVHIRDMIGVGLIDPTWTDRFNDPLKSRLQELLDDPYG